MHFYLYLMCLILNTTFDEQKQSIQFGNHKIIQDFLVQTKLHILFVVYMHWKFLDKHVPPASGLLEKPRLCSCLSLVLCWSSSSGIFYLYRSRLGCLSWWHLCHLTGVNYTHKHGILFDTCKHAWTRLWEEIETGTNKRINSRRTTAKLSKVWFLWPLEQELECSRNKVIEINIVQRKDTYPGTQFPRIASFPVWLCHTLLIITELLDNICLFHTPHGSGTLPSVRCTEPAGRALLSIGWSNMKETDGR